MKELRYFKVVVSFERRPDGGLRAWSEAVPGFVLSHWNVEALLGDIKPALDAILSARLGCAVVTDSLDDLHLQLEDEDVVERPVPVLPSQREYVAHRA